MIARPAGFLSLQGAKMAEAPERDEIARCNGFDSYADLLSVSRLLPLSSADTVRTYIARRAGGYWFIWEERTQGPTDTLRSAGECYG